MKLETIKLDTISKLFTTANQDIMLFQGMNLSFHTKKSYAIIGPSGSGKSTLLHIICGLEEPTDGTIQLLDQTSHPIQEKDIPHSIGLLFQTPFLINELSILENVMLHHIIHGTVTPDAKKMALELLQTMQLDHKKDLYPHMLSGGEQQRIALARALCHQPSFLVADEPTANLDRASAQTIADLLRHYQKAYGLGLIIATHDPLIIHTCDYTIPITDHQNFSKDLHENI